MGYVSPQTVNDWRQTIADMAMTGKPVDLGGLVEQFVTSLYNRRVADLTKYGFIHRGLCAWHQAILDELQRVDASGDAEYTGVDLVMLTAQEIAAKAPKQRKNGRSNNIDPTDVRRTKHVRPMTTPEELRRYRDALESKRIQVESDLAKVEKYIADASSWQQRNAADLQNVSRELYEIGQSVLAVFGETHCADVPKMGA